MLMLRSRRTSPKTPLASADTAPAPSALACTCLPTTKPQHALHSNKLHNSKLSVTSSGEMLAGQLPSDYSCSIPQSPYTRIRMAHNRDGPAAAARQLPAHNMFLVLLPAAGDAAGNIAGPAPRKCGARLVKRQCFEPAAGSTAQRLEARPGSALCCRLNTAGAGASTPASGTQRLHLQSWI